MSPALSIICVWCEKPLLDVAHAKEHVAEQCEKAPWRKQIARLRIYVLAAMDHHADCFRPEHDADLRGCSVMLAIGQQVPYDIARDEMRAIIADTPLSCVNKEQHPERQGGLE